MIDWMFQTVKVYKLDNLFLWEQTFLYSCLRSQSVCSTSEYTFILFAKYAIGMSLDLEGIEEMPQSIIITYMSSTSFQLSKYMDIVFHTWAT